jgi:hypothetical protein
MHTNKQREKLAALEAGQQKKFGERESKLYGEEQGIGSKIKSKVKGFFTKKNLAGLASKAGSGLKSLAGMAGSKLSGMLGDKAGEAKDHFLGKSKDKEEGGKASGGGGGGGGGSAIGTIMEKYAEVVEENKKLKAELEKLKPKKEVAEN